MKTEKVYIVITRYALQDNNIGMTILNSLEEAMKEAMAELAVTFTSSVEIFEADKAERIFFGRQIFNKTK